MSDENSSFLKKLKPTRGNLLFFAGFWVVFFCAVLFAVIFSPLNLPLLIFAINPSMFLQILISVALITSLVLAVALVSLITKAIYLGVVRKLREKRVDVYNPHSALCNLTFDEVGMQCLGEDIKVTSCDIDTLSFDSCCFSRSAMMALSKICADNPKVKMLQFTYHHSYHPPSQLGVLFKALKKSTSVRILSVDNRHLNSSEQISLFGTLRANTSPRILELSSVNKIDDLGAKALSEALKVNTTLTTLCFSSRLSGFEAEGWLFGERALKVNTTLTTLFEALGVNTGLTTLDLSNNYIDDVRAGCLLKALEKNVTLTKFSVDSGRISDDYGKKIKERLERNSAFQGALEEAEGSENYENKESLWKKMQNEFSEEKYQTVIRTFLATLQKVEDQFHQKQELQREGECGFLTTSSRGLFSGDTSGPSSLPVTKKTTVLEGGGNYSPFTPHGSTAV